MGTLRSGRYSKIPDSAVFDQRLGAAALRVLAALGTYANKEGWCWPSQGTLAKRLGISRQAVGRAIKQLAALGYIRSQGQYNQRTQARVQNRYQVRYDVPVPATDTASQVAEGATRIYQGLQPEGGGDATSALQRTTHLTLPT